MILKRAIILLSGGLDSATTLAIARSEGFACYTLSVAYGQRHNAELNAAKALSAALGTHEHRIMQIDLAQFGGSALTDASLAVPIEGVQQGIPITYVPARNTIMLSLALAWAEVLGAVDIYMGVNAVDYSGYPDCRPAYIHAFENMANLATKSAIEGNKLSLHTPLIHMTKAEIIQRGCALGVDYAMTVSCYQADEQGGACGLCDACRLRKAGFEVAGLADSTRYVDSIHARARSVTSRELSP